MSPAPSRVLDAAAMTRGRRELSRSDPRLAPWIRAVGPIDLPRPPSHFRSLLRAIIAQQLSNKAAKTIITRVFALCPSPHRPRPCDLLALPDDALRGAGLSGQKLGYVRELSRAFAEGHLRGYPFSRRSDERIVDALIRVRGVGRWTAEMFLIFSLRRPDVYSTGDLALRHGLERLEGRELTPSETGELARAWSPWRSLASLYLWRIAHWDGEDP